MITGPQEYLGFPLLELIVWIQMKSSRLLLSSTLMPLYLIITNLHSIHLNNIHPLPYATLRYITTIIVSGSSSTLLHIALIPPLGQTTNTNVETPVGGVQATSSCHCICGDSVFLIIVVREYHCSSTQNRKNTCLM